MEIVLLQKCSIRSFAKDWAEQIAEKVTHSCSYEKENLYGTGWQGHRENLPIGVSSGSMGRQEKTEGRNGIKGFSSPRRQGWKGTGS